jgi:hypothetical protein
MQQSGSFALELKKILQPRNTYFLERGELLEAPPVKNNGILILCYRMAQSNFDAIFAINFSRSASIETFNNSSYANTTAINLESGLSENKLFSSSFFELKLDPLSAKLILFQPTYFQK